MKEDDERKGNVGDAAPSYDSSVSSNTTARLFECTTGVSLARDLFAQDDYYSLMFGNNNWYYLLRMHTLLCDRLQLIRRCSLEIVQEEEQHRFDRKESTAIALRLKNPRKKRDSLASSSHSQHHISVLQWKWNRSSTTLTSWTASRTCSTATWIRTRTRTLCASCSAFRPTTHSPWTRSCSTSSSRCLPFKTDFLGLIIHITN